MANLPQLTLADQALANAIYCMAGMDLFGPDDKADMFVSIIADLLLQANRDHFYVGHLVEAGEVIRDCYDAKRRGYIDEAFQAARKATRQFAHWRLGEALERLKYGERAA